MGWRCSLLGSFVLLGLSSGLDFSRPTSPLGSPPSPPNTNATKKPLLLFLPGLDGSGRSGSTQWPRLSAEFDVWRLSIPSEDRSTFEQLCEQVGSARHLFSLTLSRLAFSRLVFSRLDCSRRVFSRLVFSRPVCSRPVFSRPVFSRPVLSRCRPFVFFSRTRIRSFAQACSPPPIPAPPHLSPYESDWRLSFQVEAFLRAHGASGRRPALLVGESSGAVFALGVALREPQLVWGLCLINPGTGYIRSYISALAPLLPSLPKPLYESLPRLGSMFIGKPNWLRPLIEDVAPRTKVIFVFFAHPPISPICRTPLLPISHI